MSPDECNAAIFVWSFLHYMTCFEQREARLFVLSEYTQRAWRPEMEEVGREGQLGYV